MTLVCVMILIAGSLYFAYGKLESDRVRQVNGELSSAFHSGATGKAEGGTPAPSQASSSRMEGTLLGSESEPTDTGEPTSTSQPALSQASSSGMEGTLLGSESEPADTGEPMATAQPALSLASSSLASSSGMEGTPLGSESEPTDTGEPTSTAQPAPSLASSNGMEGTLLGSESESARAEEPMAMAQSAPSADDGQDWQDFDPFDLPDVLDVPVATPVPAAGVQPAFQELYDRNNDLIGWIQMGDCVDYPVLWRDNSFYMDHDFYGQSSQAGSIFLDARNSPDMTDSAMLIYGHNMRSGEMFGDLDRYREAEYLREYPIITLQSAWESEPRKYVLISLFDASMNKDDPSYIRIVRTAFEDDAVKEAFIAEMRARSMYDIPVDANADDQLLTLVTCSYSHSNGRFLLFARQLRDGETKSGIVERFQEVP